MAASGCSCSRSIRARIGPCSAASRSRGAKTRSPSSSSVAVPAAPPSQRPCCLLSSSMSMSNKRSRSNGFEREAEATHARDMNMQPQPQPQPQAQAQPVPQASAAASQQKQEPGTNTLDEASPRARREKGAGAWTRPSPTRVCGAWRWLRDAWLVGALLVSASRSRVVSTVSLLSGLQHAPDFGSKLCLLEQVTDWSSIDVNLETDDGLTLHKEIVQVLKLAAGNAVYQWKYHDSIEPMFPDVIRKLLERKPALPGNPSRSWSHPLASAGDMMQHMVMELRSLQSTSIVAGFIEHLIAALHQINFDLNSRDAQGRTLLIACASAEGASADVLKQLLRHGANPVGRDRNGVSIALAWTQAGRADLLLAALSGHSPWPELGVQVDIFDRDASGRTLLQAATEKAAADQKWHVVATSIRTLQRHWIQLERPMQLRTLSEHTSLIPDLSAIVMAFVDGLDSQGRPIEAAPASAAGHL